MVKITLLAAGVGLLLFAAYAILTKGMNNRGLLAAMAVVLGVTLVLMGALAKSSSHSTDTSIPAGNPSNDNADQTSQSWLSKVVSIPQQVAAAIGGSRVSKSKFSAQPDADRSGASATKWTV